MSPFSFTGVGAQGWQNVTAVAGMSNNSPGTRVVEFLRVKINSPPDSVPFSLFPCEGSCKATAFVVKAKDNKQIEGVSGEEKEGWGGGATVM